MDQESIDFELMLDNLDDAVWMADSDGRIVYTNRSYQIMCSRSKEWFQAQNVYELRQKGYTDTCCTKMVCEKKKRIRMIQHMVGPDIGVSLEVLQTCTPIFDAYGEVKYVLGDAVSTNGLQRVYGKAVREDMDLRGSCEVEDAPDIIAESPAMQRILQLAGYVTDVDSNVLILGESGVGKNALAAYIHRNSSRSKGRIIEVNCAALPENLLESELFGYERGAFTGALSSGKSGLFEDTDGGTMFLNEINSLPLSMQGKLLQTIETKTIRRVGSSSEIPVDFRLIAAANTDLWECVKNGAFREDLYYRLNVAAFLIPPLRERKEDIIPLCLKFLDHFCKAYGRNKLLSKTVLDCLAMFPFTVLTNFVLKCQDPEKKQFHPVVNFIIIFGFYFVELSMGNFLEPRYVIENTAIVTFLRIMNMLINIFCIQFGCGVLCVIAVENTMTIKHNMEEMEKLMHQAEASNEAKSVFLANMSHEIRTPMNAICGMADLLLDEKLSEQGREYAATIKTSGEGLLSIINDILDFSKIESGKMPIVPEEYYFSSMIHDVTSMMEVRLKGRPVELIAKVSDSVPRKNS